MRALAFFCDPGLPLPALPSFGARAASRATTSSTYRQAVVVLTPNPAAISANVSPLRRQASTRRACCPGASSRLRDPIALRRARMIRDA